MSSTLTASHEAPASQDLVSGPSTRRQWRRRSADAEKLGWIHSAASHQQEESPQWLAAASTPACRWNRIVPARVPGVATRDAPERQPRPAKEPVRAQRLHRVLGARRRKPAARRRSSERVQER